MGSCNMWQSLIAGGATSSATSVLNSPPQKFLKKKKELRKVLRIEWGRLLSDYEIVMIWTEAAIDVDGLRM